MGVKDYDLNPDNNTLINGINIAEGCPPSGINNAMRQLMADVKEDSDAQNEALKKFSETPASAEDLGPVKVGDGLSMGDDGVLSANIATDEEPGRVKASETAKAGVVPVAKEDGTLDLSWLGLLNSRLVITESNESWTPPAKGWARVTVIGGGGSGGAGGKGAKGGVGGNQGGTSSFASLTADGGSGGGGGASYANNEVAGGGGGGAGEIKTEFVYLSSQVKVVIGAGGERASGVTSTNDGGDGEGPTPGKGGVGRAGGGGAPGASNGGGVPVSNSAGTGGSGGVNGSGYGSGGGGGAGCRSTDVAASGGAAAQDAESGASITSPSDSPYGGAGGHGAVIVEYYDPTKEVA